VDADHVYQRFLLGQVDSDTEDGEYQPSSDDDTEASVVDDQEDDMEGAVLLHQLLTDDQENILPTLLARFLQSTNMPTRHQLRYAEQSSESLRLAQLIQQSRPLSTPTPTDRTSCVICHSEPRIILLRPCGCLTMCNDCRLTMSVRGFEHCPCCRRLVYGYSRIYEP
jgi:hypothetical protein